MKLKTILVIAAICSIFSGCSSKSLTSSDQPKKENTGDPSYQIEIETQAIPKTDENPAPQTVQNSVNNGESAGESTNVPSIVSQNDQDHDGKSFQGSSYIDRILPIAFAFVTSKASENTDTTESIDNDASDAHDKTALMKSAEAGDIDAVKALIESGMNVNILDDAGRSALMYAANDEVFNALLAADAKVKVVDKHNKTSMFFAPSPNAVKVLIEAGVHVDDQDDEDKTPIMYAKDAQSVKWLLEAGADPNTKDNEGKTPIMYANDAQSVKWLLEAGAEPNAKDQVGRTPIMYANDTGSVKWLLEAGAEPNIKDNAGSTPIMYAENAESIRLLIEAGAEPSAKNNYGKTTLMYAKDAESVKLLIDAGVDLNAKDNYGYTALHSAINLEVLLALIISGANVNATAQDGSAPLHRYNNLDTINLLIAAGVDVNAKDHFGNTPLMNYEDGDSLKVLIAAGADMHAKNKYGNTALQYHTEKKHIEAIKILLEAGAAETEDERKESLEIIEKYTMPENEFGDGKHPIIKLPASTNDATILSELEAFKSNVACHFIKGSKSILNYKAQLIACENAYTQLIYYQANDGYDLDDSWCSDKSWSDRGVGIKYCNDNLFAVIQDTNTKTANVYHLGNLSTSDEGEWHTSSTQVELKTIQTTERSDQKILELIWETTNNEFAQQGEDSALYSTRTQQFLMSVTEQGEKIESGLILNTFTSECKGSECEEQ